MPKECEYCSKLLSKLQIKRKQKFCSKECVSLSLVRRISVNCDGCGKQFLKKPCFQRHFNYCSLDCYWNSTRRKVERKCLVCEKLFLVKEYLVKQGYGLYCSRSCQHKTYPKRIKKKCPQCGVTFEIWPSIVDKRMFCSEKCRDDSRRDYVASVCKKCGKKFELPRSDWNRGRGNFCTYRCYLTYRGPSTLEEKMERVLRLLGIKFKREIKFKRFHVDFLIDKLKLVIECDGEHWHMMPKIQDRDRRKEMYLQSLGYRVLRFTGRQITNLPELPLAKVVKKQIFTYS